MTDRATIAKLRELPLEERLRLMEEVWASHSDAPDRLEVPDWHREELDARIDAHPQDPEAARSWQDVKVEILHLLDK